MNLNELRQERKKPAVIFLRFCQDKEQHNKCLFCFFEGEDSKYYLQRITQYTGISDEELIPYNCEGRQGVLKTRFLIEKDSMYRQVKKAYFIDRDYIPETNIKCDVYQTPSYSIENFYTSETAFKRILKVEFQMHYRDKDYIRTLNNYKQRHLEFLQHTLLLNAWLYCQRIIETEKNEKKINLSDFKIKKLFKYIRIDELNCEPIDLPKIYKSFTAYYSVCENEIENAKQKFLSNSSMYRGKFELIFLKEILIDLKQKHNNNEYFEQKYKCVYLDVNNSNTLSVLSQHADTPECLIEFLTKYKR